MTDKVQFIRSPKGEEFVIMSRAAYDRLTQNDDETLQNAADIREAKAIMKRINQGKEAMIPGAVVNAMILEGAHPVKAWRKYRKMTGDQLAHLVGISRPYITQIEQGKRTGTIETMRAIAKALDAPVDVLITG